MITLPANYTAAASPQQIVADWLLELSYDDTTPGTFYMSSAERTVTNFYDGIVLSWGKIDQKLDLSKSKASVSDIKITVANKWNNASGLLSDELFGGTKKFINQNITIRSWLLGCAATADCLTRYTGRLVDISHDFETVTFKIEHRQPWDKLQLADAITEDDQTSGYVLPEDSFGKPKGVIYGDHQPHLKSDSTTQLTAATWEQGRKLGLTACVDLGNDTWLIAGHSVDTITEADGDSIWAWDDMLGRFVELLTGDYTVISNGASGCIISRDTESYVDYKFPVTAVSDWTNPANIADGSLATAATAAIGSFDIATMTITFPENDISGDVGTITDVRLALRGSGDWATADCKLYVEGDDTNQFSNTSMLTYFDSNGSHLGTAYAALTLSLESFAVGSFAATLYACYLACQYTTSNRRAEMPLFFGGRGKLNCSFTGGTALPATLFHRVYRDLLFGKTGWDATSLTTVEVNGAVWSAAGIDTDRDWLIRLGITDKIKLQYVLEQLQYEGCFIWMFDNESTDVDARVAFVKSTYAAGDVNATLDGDYLGSVKVNHTPLSQIVSKRIANYALQAADGYAEQNDKTNTNRGDWNFATDENIAEDSLDFLYRSADVDDFLTYYDNIVGEPKLIVSAMIEDPANWNLQRGDIVQFSNMEFDPYGETWTGKYFMITKLQISPDKFNMTAQEVG